MSPRRGNREVEVASTGVDGESSMSCELQVPTVSDVVWRYTWRVRRWSKTIAKRDVLDSPVFACSVNGVTTNWQLGVRFWRGPNGKRVSNPLAVCVSLVSCEGPSCGEQARVRFQVGVRDATISHWDQCPMGRVAVHLTNTASMLSVGYNDVRLEDRHIDKDGDVYIMVKLQMVPTEVERHTLSQDLARLMEAPEDDFQSTDTEIRSSSGRLFNAHSHIIIARSSMLATMMRKEQGDAKFKIDLTELPDDIVQELLRYVYTDKVENLESLAPRLLTLAHRYYLDGLTELCERAIVETLTPSTVGNVLMLADQCQCEPLKKAALAYCEETMTHQHQNKPLSKSLAWRVMELVNPDLYYEVCEGGMSSSMSSNLDSQGSRSDDNI